MFLNPNAITNETDALRPWLHKVSGRFAMKFMPTKQVLFYRLRKEKIGLTGIASFQCQTSSANVILKR